MARDPKFQLKHEIEVALQGFDPIRSLYSDHEEARATYMELFYSLSTDPSKLQIFELRLKEHGHDGPELILESTPSSRGALLQEAQILAGRAVLAQLFG